MIARSGPCSLALLSVFVVIGCAAPSSDSPTTNDDNEVVSQWSPRLTCDGGAAVLDGDVKDPRHQQFVVRDPNIVKFLSSRVNHLQNARGEVIVEGYADGLGFTDDAGRFDMSTNYDRTSTKRVVAVVSREGERVKLAFNEITTTRTCSGYIDGPYCRGAWSQHDDVRELANWSFQSCR
jgi:hypothetical protein